MKKVKFDSKLEFKSTQRLTEAHMISNNNVMSQFDIMLKSLWDNVKGSNRRSIVAIDVKFRTIGIEVENTYTLVLRSKYGIITYSIDGNPHRVRSYEEVRNAIVRAIVEDSYIIKYATRSLYLTLDVSMKVID